MSTPIALHHETAQIEADPATLVPKLLGRRLRRWFEPSLADVVFLLIFLRVCQLGATGLFNDPGTGWHIRTGAEILTNGAVPVVDVYSWTRLGQPWVQTQWLGDVILSAGYVLGGYPMLALMSALVIAALFRWVYRVNIEQGAWPIWAIVATILAAGAAAGHFLVRPLLMSLVGIPLCFVWSLRFLEADRPRSGPDGAWATLRGVWFLPVVALVWVNIHPGVLGGIATVGLVAIGGLIDTALTGQAKARRRLFRRVLVLWGVAGAMTCATFVNPYGLGWHRWLQGIMSLEILPTLIDEWKPPDWSAPDGLSCSLLMCLTFGALLLTRRRSRAATVLVTLFWLVQALHSARHLPLLAVILGIQAGSAISGVRIKSDRILKWVSRIPLFSTSIRDKERTVKDGLASPILVAIVVLALSFPATRGWTGLETAGPDATRFSPGLIAFLKEAPPAMPILNDLSLGGHLIQHCPELRVFIDDRFGLYGDEFVVRYCQAVDRPDRHAQALLNEWGVNTVIMRTALPLSQWLGGHPDWEESYRDDSVAVFTRFNLNVLSRKGK